MLFIYTSPSVTPSGRLHRPARSRAATIHDDSRRRLPPILISTPDLDPIPYRTSLLGV
ncbi:hypothetical protein C8Q77DRAFT_1123082 [Trametes polyzona]|nr:hypothetical protein C8Q77DRAFT_1123082 [Trametes polyzona]